MKSAFKVIEATSFEELTEKVQAALEDQWSLHGPMVVLAMGSAQAVKREPSTVQPMPSAETVDALNALRRYTGRDYEIQSALVPMMRLVIIRPTASGPYTDPVSEFVTPEEIQARMNAID